jgi:hypothetical protein
MVKRTTDVGDALQERDFFAALLQGADGRFKAEFFGLGYTLFNKWDMAYFATQTYFAEYDGVSF